MRHRALVGRPWHALRSFGGRSLGWLVCAAMVILVWLGYRATTDASRSMAKLLEQREAEQLALLWLGLSEDMQGAQTDILAPILARHLEVEPPYHLADAFARGFARFPYPESYFVWSDPARRGRTYAFNRSDRLPPWQPSHSMTGPFPVDVVRDPDALQAAIAEARMLEREGRQTAIFETDIAGTPYQIVVRLMFEDEELFPGLADDLPPIRADRSALQQVLDNLIDNAIKYSADARMLRIEARQDEEHVAIVVADRGIGIPADEIGRVSEKFFRGRNAVRGGSGLGLAIVRQLVEVHGGLLHIDSSPEAGTRVTVVLPVMPS